MEKRLVAAAASAIASLAFATTASSISLEVSSDSIPVGGTADVVISISGLGDGAAPSIGAWDFNLAWDSSILQFTGVTFGDQTLGDQLEVMFASMKTENTVAGMSNLTELSLDSAGDLDANQAGAFDLATISFLGLALGTSAVELSVNDIAVADGESPGEIPITQGEVAVPEPTAFLVFSVGLAIASRTRRRARA